MFSAALCDLPAGDDVASELSEADVNKLWWTVSTPIPPLTGSHPRRDGEDLKTATARQQWVRDKQPSMTEVMEQYSKDGRHA